jgi:predicted outer membrane repeat protein
MMKGKLVYRASAVVWAVLLLGAAVQGAIRYVALDGSGTGGQDWATAYKSIDAAIRASSTVAGDEIRVKKGTYTSSSTTFVDKAVTIRGGYSGVGETRDWATFKTIIDGTERAMHCFDVSAGAQFDGLTITNGAANGSGQYGQGGGMYIHGCHPVIANCTFRRNYAEYMGGAISLENAAGTTITDCTFTENSSVEFGGAIGCTRSDAAITNCRFEANKTGLDNTDGYGGAIRIDSCSPTVTGCTFSGNAATYGAGISNFESGALIEACTFTDCNTATLGGGGAHNRGGAPRIDRCLFSGNSVRLGGAIWDASLSTITNCILWDNTSMTSGGGIYIDGSIDGVLSGTQLINCTLYGNHAFQGGALYSNLASPNLTNCILWGNTSWDEDPEIHDVSWLTDRKTVANYSDIDGDRVYPGVGNLCVDPEFSDPDNGDFHLSVGSPCIEHGTNGVAGIPSVDYAGSRRISDGDEDGTAVVDMGAYELQGYTLVDHVSRGEIMQGMVYEDPRDAAAEYMFLAEFETDTTIGQIEFLTPAGNTYVISNRDHTASGNVETYCVRSDGGYIWQYWARFKDADGLSSYGDGTYTITYVRSVVSIPENPAPNTRRETQIAYSLPGGGPIPQPVAKPNVTSPAYGDSVASPVTLTWDVCTDRNVNAVLVNVIDADAEQSLVEDSLPGSATASSSYALPEGVCDVELSFAALYEAVDSAGVPFDLGKVAMVGHQFDVLYTTVYRFWSPVNSVHFYTINPVERDNLIDNYPYFWSYEGPVYYASSTASDANLAPVFRFWSPVNSSHFYTISEEERDWLIADYPDIWTYEGIVFYAYPEGRQPAGVKPVFRFWNPERGCHFYTISEEERDFIIRDYSYAFTFEGIAFYAYE